MRAMTITRHWLDWSRPCLPEAAHWLIDTLAVHRSRLCMLDHIVCVLPGKRAGRLLLEYLLRACEARDLHLVPPRMLTPGVIVDVLFDAPNAAPNALPIASADERLCAWAAALRQTPAESLGKLLAARPADDDVLAWHELARTIQRLHDELAGEDLTFAHAADAAERMEMFSEGERWRALQTLHEQYMSVLFSAGLTCRHAVLAGQLPLAASVSSETQLVLIGIVELNAVQRRAMQQLATERIALTALIHSPHAMEDRFDSLGCLRSSAWSETQIDLPDDCILVADSPHDQAQQTMHLIGQLSNEYATDQITLGLGDAALSQPMQLAGTWAGLSFHPSEGQPVSGTLAYRLLDAIATWLDGQRFADFASLLRHPDLERYLRENVKYDDLDRGVADWISLLDTYFSAHLHQRLDGAWLGDPAQQQRLKSIHNAVQKLLQPLIAGRPQPLGQWTDAILNVLHDVYSCHETLSYHTREACMAVRDVLAAQNSVDDRLQETTDAATALRLTLAAVSDTVIAEPSREDQIEMLGWLELHLDPAPVLIALGINDGQVPSATVADAFLPDSLRTSLGLMNNARRYARDAYLLQAIIASRQRVLLIAGRRNAGGEPLAPSRLLLACDPEKLPQRVAQLCDQQHASRWPVPMGAPVPSEQCSFLQAPAPPQQARPLDRMAVTAFRSYLACPYRFWLGHVEGLKAVSDDAEEMDPKIFGSFAHSALERFGRDEALRDSADPAAIAAALLKHVDDKARDVFGKRPAPAVRVQLERLKQRLAVFAQRQSELRTEGWVIETCEFRLPPETFLDIPSQQPMRISGVIDRIDRHTPSDAVRLIDYKTSEGGATPFEVHHGTKKYKDDCWLDLQLPLYRFLAAQHGYPDAQVGYIVLPKNPDDVSYQPGEWTTEQFDSAIEKAREIVMNIRSGLFEPNPDFRSGEFDDFATICRISVLGGDDDGDEEEAA